MRRNGENLLVLAGEEPGRRWTRPVPLVDVLRAAASEVEQYERIELSAVPTTEVAGRVVNDLVHLLAELLENATSFSSPQTKVKVTGHALPDGRVLIEIHDTGIGLSPEDLAAINERLASPPTVDVSVSRRMGLFVVGRLSQRHGIRIQLRPSDSGGTTALVMLPVDVAQGGKKVPGNKPGQGMPNGGGPAAAQAAAGVAAARRGGGRRRSRPRRGCSRRRQRRTCSVPRRSAARSVPAPESACRAAQAGRGRSPGRAGRITRSAVRAAPAGQAGPGRCRCPAQAFGELRQRRLRAGRPPSVAVGRTRSAADARTRRAAATAAPCPRSPSSVRPAGDQGRRPPQRRSCRRAVVRAPSCPAATRSRGCRAGATTTRSRRCRAPRSTPRAATRSRTPPRDAADRRPSGPGVRRRSSRGSTTVRVPVPRRRVRRGRTTTPSVPARVRSRATDSTSGPDVFGTPNPSGAGQNPSAGGQYSPPGVPGLHRPVLDARLRRVAPPASSRRPGYGRLRRTRPPPASSRRPDHGERPGPVGHRPVRASAVPTRTNGPAAPAPSVRSRVSGPRVRPGARGTAAGAGPGDGRTPLYDTLETNWFHGPGGRGRQRRSRHRSSPYRLLPAAPQQSAQPAAPAAPPRPAAAPGSAAQASWRTSPNDDLVRQAERVRQPSAGGVTTSGLPRRVPRANLVAGTAQQQTAPNRSAGLACAR